MLSAKSNPQAGVPIKGQRNEYVKDFPKELWAPTHDQTISHVLLLLKLSEKEFDDVCKKIKKDKTLRKGGTWCMFDAQETETNYFK
jgi:hypothetical protein